MNKIALTIDIEDWYHTPAVTGSPFSFYKDVPSFFNSWKTRYDYISGPTRRVLDILKQFDLKATFFVVADIIESYPGLLERIIEKGHEIACHGLHHEINIHPKSKKPIYSASQFMDITSTAKEKLEKASGRKVSGYRAPGAYVGNWMFAPLIRLGFKYDSSVNPNSFFNKTDFSTRPISSAPFKIQPEGSASCLLELPWSYNQIYFIRFPTAGGPFLRFLPMCYIAAGIRDSLKRGCTAFYFHSLDICTDKVPSLASKNIRRPFYFMTSGQKTENKLLKLLGLFQDKFTTCMEIVNNLNNNGLKNE